MSCAAIAGVPQFGSSATSHEAQHLRDVAKHFLAQTERSQVLFGVKSDTLQSLMMLAHECRERGWDGNDADPVSTDALQIAAQFASAFPSDIKAPDLTCEPDGAISFDWRQSKTRILSVSVGGSSRLAYAWLNGVDRGYGVVFFNGRTVPQRILQEIQHIIANGNPAFRPA